MQCVQQVIHAMLSSTPQVTPGFTVRSVYCCNICQLQVDDYEKIKRHLANDHKNPENVDHAVTPVQQNNTMSSSAELPSTHKSNSVWGERSCKPVVCPKCRQVYKYRRCLERHMIKRHKNDAELIETVNELQHDELTTIQTASDAFDSSDSELKQDNIVDRNRSTSDPLNDVDQLELEVMDIKDESLTIMPADEHRQEEADKPSKSNSVWGERSCTPVVCPKCRRVYKYRRCLERHMINQHQTAAELAEAVTELQCNRVADSRLAFSSSHGEKQQHDSMGSSTHGPLNGGDQIELQEVAVVSEDAVTSVPADEQTEQDAGEPREASYCCQECTKSFPDLSSFHLHNINKHYGWTSVCKWCGQLFIEGHELRSHTMTDHGRVLDDEDEEERAEPVFNSHRCMICGSHYRSGNELAMHMTSFHDDAFSCTMCSGHFLSQSGLTNHMQRIHSGEHPYFCELCGDRFTTTDERDVHAKQHTSELCSVCGVRLCLRRTDSGTSMCSVCYLERLSSRDAVQITDETAPSVTQRHSMAAPLPAKYSCTKCGVRFAWHGNLLRHERRMHGFHDLRPDAARHFQCSYCGRVFGQVGGLRRHIRRHINPGAYQQTSLSCQLCGQQFSWKKSLIRHMHTAHPPSSAQCRIPFVTSMVSKVNIPGSSAAVAQTDGSREQDQSNDQFGSSEVYKHSCCKLAVKKIMCF